MPTPEGTSSTDPITPKAQPDVKVQVRKRCRRILLLCALREPWLFVLSITASEAHIFGFTVLHSALHPISGKIKLQ